MQQTKKKKRVRNDDKTKVVSIKIDKLVKEYSDYMWHTIAGITMSEAATRLSRGQGVPSVDDKKLCERIQVLIKLIDKFFPNKLMTWAEAASYRNSNLAWRSRLMSVARSLQHDTRPRYLVDEVQHLLDEERRQREYVIKASILDITDAKKNKLPLTDDQKVRLRTARQQLRDLRHQFVCSPLIICKYLHIIYREGMSMSALAEKMKPSVVARFLIRYSGTVWETLPIEQKEIKSSVRVDAKSTWKAADILHHIALPSSCQATWPLGLPSYVLIDDVEHDIKVLENYVKCTWEHKRNAYEDFLYDLSTPKLQPLEETHDHLKAASVIEYLQSRVREGHQLDDRQKIVAAQVDIEKFSRSPYAADIWKELKEASEAPSIVSPVAYILASIRKRTKEDL